MYNEDRAEVAAPATPLADALALTVSAMALLAGAYWVGNPAWIDRIPHWALLLIFGSAVVAVWGIAKRERRLHTKVSRSRLKLMKAACAFTVVSDLLVLGLGYRFVVNKETIVMTTLIIAFLQAFMAAGLWLHWIFSKIQRFAN